MRRDWIAITRDVGSLLIGFGGLIHQEYILGAAIPELLLVYTAILAVPGAVGLVSLRRGDTEAQSTSLVESDPPTVSP